jgi:hypothetical protein
MVAGTLITRSLKSAPRDPYGEECDADGGKHDRGQRRSAPGITLQRGRRPMVLGKTRPAGECVTGIELYKPRRGAACYAESELEEGRPVAMWRRMM